ncbi:MAG: OmpH family outer membrane protein [Bacteroidota bacterium]|nr:OmpH family outer membrane protein [Bacteroidota bacterium]MDP4204953.1 OmpH family outer membrane protein [Bacteroidota bacterium]
MKKTSLIINAVLAVAIIVLFILHFKSSKAGKNEASDDKNISGKGVSIAYVKMDSLIMNYQMAKDLQSEMSKKQEEFNRQFGSRKSDFEHQAAAFQEKIQHGGFLTQDKAVQERDRLMNEEQKIKQLDYQLSTSLQQLQQENNKKLFDVINAFLKEYNKDHNYTYILNGGDVLIGAEKLNITTPVLTELNKRYLSTKGK